MRDLNTAAVVAADMLVLVLFRSIDLSTLATLSLTGGYGSRTGHLTLLMSNHDGSLYVHPMPRQNEPQEQTRKITPWQHQSQYEDKGDEEKKKVKNKNKKMLLESSLPCANPIQITHLDPAETSATSYFS